MVYTQNQRLYLDFNFKDKEYVGSYFGLPSSEPEGDFDSSLVLPVQVKPLEQGITLVQVSEIDESGLVSFKFSQTVKFTDSEMEKEELFEKFFTFSLEGSNSDTY